MKNTSEQILRWLQIDIKFLKCIKYISNTVYFWDKKLEKVIKSFFSLQKLAKMHVSNNHVDIRLENFRQVQLCSMYGKYLFVVDIETNPLLEKKKICLNYLYITHYSYCYTIAVPYQVVKVVSFLIWHVKTIWFR